MFRRKKKKEKTVRKVSLNIEQLFHFIKEHPEGLKFEEIQQVLSKKNIDRFFHTPRDARQTGTRQSDNVRNQTEKRRGL